MDLTSLIGPIIALATIGIGLIMEGGHLSSVFQITAAFIVLGGTFGSLLVAYPLKDVFFSLKELITFFRPASVDLNTVKTEIIDLAHKARKESILALEKTRASLSYEPLRQAVKLAADGTDPNEIRKTIETVRDITYEENEVAVKFWEDGGAIAPTMGILGAVLGLIHVMENLDKPEMIGPGIAIAFVATLYGVGGANIFFIPIAKKLKRKYLIHVHAQEMVILGMESILSGLNPKIIEEKLSAFGSRRMEEPPATEKKAA